MNPEIQSILLRRKSKVVVLSNHSFTEISTCMLGSVIGNFGSLGYVMSKELIDELYLQGNSSLISFYKEVYPILQKQVGAGYNFKPMYPNFPDQMANASDSELYINAIMHYFGDMIGARILPEYETEVRFPFCESANPKFLGLANIDDISLCLKSLLEMKASPSVQDKADIDSLFKIYAAEIICNTITFQNKEVMAYVCAKEPVFFKSLKTATDVLRVIVALNNGDISLAKNTKFGKISRPMRRFILEILNKMDQNSVREDMMRFEGMWIRLGEKLHPGEYTTKLPYIASSFAQLRNGDIKTTNSKIESLLASKDWTNLLITLKTRPGDFARRINAVFSKTENKIDVITAFKSVIDKVSTPVLWQLYGYYNSYNKQLEFRNRIFLPKTPVALVLKNNLIPLESQYRLGMCQLIYSALWNNYQTSDKLFKDNKPLKAWIDPVCKSLLIPSGNRSASTALRQVARGSRFKLKDNCETVRLFTYWKDVEADNTYSNRVDLDLSAMMWSKDWNYLGHCSWTNLRSRNNAMYHSGDITSAPQGASEFLDINLIKLDENVCYITTNVYNYTGQKFNELNVGFCGWMEREYPGSGEIFEPTSVEGRCDLTANATSSTPMILDVKTREIVWADLPITLNGSELCTENTMDKSIATSELATRLSTTKASLFTVFSCMINAHCGILTENRDEANFIITEDGDLSPYDIAKVMDII